jgi:hypothetical protein
MLAKLDKRDVEMIMGSGVQLRGEIHIELLDDHCRFCTFPTTSKQNESINNIGSGRYGDMHHRNRHASSRNQRDGKRHNHYGRTEEVSKGHGQHMDTGSIIAKTKTKIKAAHTSFLNRIKGRYARS